MRISSSKLGRLLTSKGCKSMIEYIKNNLYTTSYNLRGAYSGRRLRIYGFTDSPPSLPLFSSCTPFTRNRESSYCRSDTSPSGGGCGGTMRTQ